jgi:hypothetical protein
MDERRNGGSRRTDLPAVPEDIRRYNPGLRRGPGVSDPRPAVDNAVRMVLDRVAELQPSGALTLLQRPADMLWAMQEASDTGNPLTQNIDVPLMESTPGLKDLVSTLVEIDPEYRAAAAIAEAALRCRLLDMPGPFVV